MQIPLIAVTAVWVQALPAVAVIARRNLSRPVLWIAGGAFITVMGDLISLVVARETGNNHWVIYTVIPIAGCAYLLGLAEWQPSYIERLTVRLSVLPFAAAYFALVFLVEDLTTFSKYSAPFYSLAILGASLWTLLRRAFQPMIIPLTRADWFWVAFGLALYGATTAASSPIGGILLAGHRLDLFELVWKLRAVCIDIAFLSVFAGMLLPAAEPRPAW